MGSDMRRLVLEAPYKMRMERVPVPRPGAGEICIRVQRVGVCGSDLTTYRGRHPYVTFPRVMGHEIAGTIEATGAGVTSPTPGTRVAVIPHIVCGACDACGTETYNFCEQLQCTGAEADGAHCDYFCIRAVMAIPVPDSMSLDDAALVEPACVAYHGARRGEIRAGDKVLIIGAGPIGLFCAQSCRALGAETVYLADLDAGRLAVGRDLGADGVIHVAQESLEAGLDRLCGGAKRLDVFFDGVGEKGRVLNDILRLARRGSRVVMIGVLQNGYDIPNLPDFVQHELRLSGTTMYIPQDYREMLALMGDGRVRTTGMISGHITLEAFPELIHGLDKGTVKTVKTLIDMER